MIKQSISTLIFFFLLVSISSMKMEAEIDSKAFQEIMEDFVEVHNEANEDADVDTLLTNVKINIESSEKNYGKFLATFLLSCNNAKAKVATFVKGLENARLDAQNKIANTWTKQSVSARKQIKSAQDEALNTERRLESIRKEMTQIVVDFTVGVTETNEKLSVVKQLRDIIEDELVNPGKSFIQLSNFNQKLSNLESLIKKSGDTMYTPIIETLVQLASGQNFSDQGILKAILKNLNALEMNLTKFKKDKEVSMNVTLKNLKSQEENLVSQLDDYHHLEQRYVSDVSEANQNINLLTQDVLSLNGEITRKSEELRNIAHLCDTENDMFKLGKERLAAVKEGLKVALTHQMSLKK